jgi:gliding motility-associated lipoprotein GldD
MYRSLLLKRWFGLFFIATVVVLQSCNSEYAPKPKGYPRVIYPEKKYEVFSPPSCPFEFEKPVYAVVERDSVFQGKALLEPCWINIQFPEFNGSLNLTYKEINEENTLVRLVEDAHKLSFKHSKKANFIDEVLIENQYGVSGLLYDVGGEAASNFQFFLTDTNHHFIRGALYFNNEPNMDSMAPVISFVRKDLDHFLETFKWR